jgi:hypothetical protein
MTALQIEMMLHRFATVEPCATRGTRILMRYGAQRDVTIGMLRICSGCPSGYLLTARVSPTSTG